MINFLRMVLAATCTVTVSFEIALNTKLFMTTIILQAWSFTEWIGSKNNNKITYDPVLHDILHLLAQIVIFCKVLFFNQ